MACDLYRCLLQQCEALHACYSGRSMATVEYFLNILYLTVIYTRKLNFELSCDSFLDGLRNHNTFCIQLSLSA